MVDDIAAMNKWLLMRVQDKVTRLEEETPGVVVIGDSIKLDLKGVRLMVPPRVEVYRLKPELFRNGSELVLTTRGKELDPVYLSRVEKENGALNYAGNTGRLAGYPWCDSKDTGMVFYSMIRNYSDVLRGCLFRFPKEEFTQAPNLHPLALDLRS